MHEELCFRDGLAKPERDWRSTTPARVAPAAGIPPFQIGVL